MINQSIDIAGRFLANPVIKPNASLSFSVATGSPTMTVDEVGNPILVQPATRVETIECWLEQRKIPLAEVQEGSYLDCEYFEGRLVKPKDYPLPILASGEVRVIVNGRSGVIRQLNAFESPMSQQLGIASKLGRRIKVYIRFDQGY